MKTNQKYPLSVIESQGAMIGTDMCIVSGFKDGINMATPEIWCVDTKDTSAPWIQQDSLTAGQSLAGNDLSLGVSHGGFVVVGSKVSPRCDKSTRSFIPWARISPSFAIHSFSTTNVEVTSARIQAWPLKIASSLTMQCQRAGKLRLSRVFLWTVPVVVWYTILQATH